MVAIFPPLYQAGGIFANLRWACKCHTDFLQAAWSTHVFKHKMSNSTLVTYKQPSTQHCPKNNLTLRIKTEPVTVGANATVYIWFLCQIYTIFAYVFKSHIYTVHSFKLRPVWFSRFIIYLGQCIVWEDKLKMILKGYSFHKYLFEERS